ncbi:MAG: hypothetical protein K1X67_18155 [Fimbriimonadaceae bacterium]|nr:hypothetical protein [Fimbriimonadaceae bacterium]
MTVLSSVVIALVFLSPQERFGMSTGQILKYSPDKWIEFYENRVRKFDPITDGEAAAVYAACIRERYGPKWKALSTADRQRLTQIEVHGAGFKNECFEIQYATGGGGTIYSHLQRLTVIDDAQLIEALLMKSSAPLKTEAQVAAAFKDSATWLDKQAKPSAATVEMIKAAGMTATDVKKKIDQARTHLAILQRQVKGRSLNERAHVAAYVKRWTQPIVGE